MRLMNIDALGQGIAGLSSLHTLRLHFDWCYNIRNVDAQGRGASSYMSVINVDGLRRGLAKLPAFTRCKITTRFHQGDPFLDWEVGDDDRELSHSRSSGAEASAVDSEGVDSTSADDTAMG